jgi:hypothetical protein
MESKNPSGKSEWSRIQTSAALILVLGISAALVWHLLTF